ncbi:MAG: transporter, partial [Bacteroidota bacterium]|nr:transporter [Bacteroidota bacterium]
LIAKDAYKGINTWIIYLAIPAMALKYLPTVQWSRDLLLPALMPVVVWAGAWILFKLYSLKFKVSPATRAALTLTAGLGNTSFIGFPLIQAYYGMAAIGIAVISDQVTFMLMSTVGVITAMSAAGSGNLKAAVVLKRLFSFPPFLASIAALVLPRFVDISPLNPLFDAIAATLVPLALFSVGLQLNFTGWQNEIKLLAVGLGYKLLIAPAFVFALAYGFKLRGIIPQISVFEAAMAPMITASVIAVEFDLNPQLANLMVGIGILVAFATSAGWWFLNTALNY